MMYESILLISSFVAVLGGLFLYLLFSVIELTILEDVAVLSSQKMDTFENVIVYLIAVSGAVLFLTVVYFIFKDLSWLF